MDLNHLNNYGYDYVKIWIDPWSRLTKLSPPIWYRRLILEAMFEIYYTWESQLIEAGEPFYLLRATLLGRLAVDSTYQGQGIGELVLIDALKRILNATAQIASVAVVVEAINENAVRFYQKYGFRQFKQYSLKLYLPTKSISESELIQTGLTILSHIYVFSTA